MLDKKEIVEAMPPHLKSVISDELVGKINSASQDPIEAQSIRDNFLNYTGVLREGRFKTEDYLNAVTYVSYKLMGLSNKEAYAKTFPVRYQGLVAKGTSTKDISAYVSAYNKGKLVNLIFDQTMIPAYVLNQDLFQKALNTQADLMLTAKSEKVRSDAANSILTHLKRPEKTVVDVNVGLQENSGMTELRNLLTDVASQQQKLIEQGVPTNQIAQQKLVPTPIEDAEVIEVKGTDDEQ